MKIGKITYKPETKEITLIANLTATAVALRIIKHTIIGPFQFINFPCAFSVIAGIMLGPINGLITGMLTFIVSDIFLGLGPWTFITSTLSGIIGLISGLIWKTKKISKIEVLILSYLLFLIYDITSSFLLYLPFMPPTEAFTIGIIGLFLPIMGGYLYAVGPITEFSTAMITSIIITKINGHKEEGKNEI